MIQWRLAVLHTVEANVEEDIVTDLTKQSSTLL